MVIKVGTSSLLRTEAGTLHLSQICTLCETDHRSPAPDDPSVVFRHLHAHGIREVYLDMDIAERLYGGAPAYRDCIHRLLPGFRHERGAYLVFNVPEPD